MDVEGFENSVLEGAVNLLSNPAKSPEKIFIETHPYAWSDVKVLSEKILGALKTNGYQVVNPVDMSPVESIESYGHIWLNPRIVLA